MRTMAIAGTLAPHGANASSLDGDALDPARPGRRLARRGVVARARCAHAELPEHLAQAQERAQHRASVVVALCALFPALDLLIERRGDLGGDAVGEGAFAGPPPA